MHPARIERGYFQFSGSDHLAHGHGFAYGKIRGNRQHPATAAIERRRLKGPERPVQSEASRAAVLASLAAVDLVVVFGEDTPLELIRALKPDVLVKGADYAKDQVVGGAEVESWGGAVVLAELLDGHSTTGTLKRLNEGR